MANTRNETRTQENKTPATSNSLMSSRSEWIIPGLLVLITILLIISLARGWDSSSARPINKESSPQHISRQAERGDMPGLRGFMDDSNNHLVGAVTAVNGDSFTVVGNGTTTNVLTNSSTRFWGGSSVKVNDSVGVLGTNSNGTLTATQIVINP